MADALKPLGPEVVDSVLLQTMPDLAEHVSSPMAKAITGARAAAALLLLEMNARRVPESFVRRGYESAIADLKDLLCLKDVVENPPG